MASGTGSSAHVCVRAHRRARIQQSKAVLDHPPGLLQSHGSCILLSGLHQLQSSTADFFQWIIWVLLFFPMGKLGTGRAEHRDSTWGSPGGFPSIREGVFHPIQISNLWVSHPLASGSPARIPQAGLGALDPPQGATSSPPWLGLHSVQGRRQGALAGATRSQPGSSGDSRACRH